MDDVFMFLAFVICFMILAGVSSAIVYMGSMLVDAARNITRKQR